MTRTHLGPAEDRHDFLTREPPEVHALGCFVHGALTALHALGVVYNYRRQNWRDVVAHVAAGLYDAHSVCHHYRMEQAALRAARVSPAVCPAPHQTPRLREAV